MTTQHIETLIIGAGQAGLATGYQLKRLGREFLIVDGMARVGDNWRCHYDSLTLFTPARANSLDGMPYPGDPWHFPTKDEFADYLELYAVTHDLPVRMQTRVERLSGRDGGGFAATIGTDEITCDNVVVASGTFGRTAQVPAFAGGIAPTIGSSTPVPTGVRRSFRTGLCSSSVRRTADWTSPTRWPRRVRSRWSARIAGTSRSSGDPSGSDRRSRSSSSRSTTCSPGAPRWGARRCSRFGTTGFRSCGSSAGTSVSAAWSGSPST
ncbi:NAD(P)-binding domain-containing protein [Lentzea indica]|uniref:NAD(P)-binding domain-containing protein n=1 Tax=Lentzea indica TaxID=2604800 RepID=UPI001FEA6FDD|nr:NAD(P)-binding domain-containing protein [Lentzea indica]